MNLNTLLIQITAAIFALYGVAFILAPTPLAMWVTETAPTSTIALTDMRATYGGMSLAVGLILFCLAAQAQYVRMGLTAVLMLMLGMASGRLVGIVVDGSTSTTMVLYLAIEVIGAVAAGFLLLRTPKL